MSTADYEWPVVLDLMPVKILDMTHQPGSPLPPRPQLRFENDLGALFDLTLHEAERMSEALNAWVWKARRETHDDGPSAPRPTRAG